MQHKVLRLPAKLPMIHCPDLFGPATQICPDTCGADIAVRSCCEINRYLNSEFEPEDSTWYRVGDTLGAWSIHRFPILQLILTNAPRFSVLLTGEEASIFLRPDTSL